MTENSESFDEDAVAILHYFNTLPAAVEILEKEYQTRLQLYPCLHPVNPHMENVAVRVVTFNQRRVRNRMRATSTQIAEAGFFVWGGSRPSKVLVLQYWCVSMVYTDEPWIEHSKWSPTCEFLLQKKRLAFFSGGGFTF